MPKIVVPKTEVLNVAEIDKEHSENQFGWGAYKRTPSLAWEPERYRGANRTTYHAQYGFHYIRGNTLPYFSITVESVSRSGNGPGGCMHDEIAKKWRSVAYLIRWHLCDGDGTPMHYVANAKWWRDMVLGEVEPDKYARHAPADVWARHVVYGVLPDDFEEPHQALVNADWDWLAKRLPALQQAFKADMKKAGFILPDVWQSGRKQ